MRPTHRTTALHVEHWGAEDGFRLTVFDRRGYGHSPAAPSEDFVVDATDVAALLR